MLDSRVPTAGGIGLAAVIVGLLVRAYLGFVMPLPPDRWWLGLVSGLGQDFVAAIPFAFLGLCPWRAARVAQALGQGALLLAFACWSEAVVYFGHPPRRAELMIGFQADFLFKSLDLSFATRLVILLLVFAAAVVWGTRFLRSSRPATLLVGILAGGLVAAVSTRLLWGTPAADAFRNPLFTLVSLLREGRGKGELGSLEPPKPILLVAKIRELTPSIPFSSFVSGEFPLAYVPRERATGAPAVPPGQKPNIVFVVMEGVRSHEIGAYGGTIPGLTPNLDRLAARGVRVEKVYSPGTCTPDGEVALWYGLMAIPDGPVITRWPRVRLSGLPEALGGAGWRSFLWIHNSEQTFYREDRFYLPRGFRMIDGRDFPADDTTTNWGKSDLVLMRRALLALDRLPEPFAAMVLTISNHHPFQVPSDARSGLDLRFPKELGFRWVPWLPAKLWHYTGPMLRTIHYTDEAVGEFFDEARKRKWFERTIFVVTSDHGLPVEPLEGMTSAHQFSELRHGVPLIFLGPALGAGQVVRGPATLADVAPTLLGLVGLSGVRAGTGTDLLDRRGEDLDRPVIAWDDEARLVTVAMGRRVYHGKLRPEARPSAALDAEGLFDAASEPGRAEDLAAKEPAVTAAYRRLAWTYLEIYPWLVASGRSGIPPAPPVIAGTPSSVGTTP